MSDNNYKYKNPFHTKKYLNQIVDTKTGNVLGEWIKYGTSGGWVMNTEAPFGSTTVTCHLNDETPDNPKVQGIELTTSTGVKLRSFAKFTSYIFLNKVADKDDKTKKGADLF
jgi:hypothetical protein